MFTYEVLSSRGHGTQVIVGKSYWLFTCFTCWAMRTTFFTCWAVRNHFSTDWAMRNNFSTGWAMRNHFLPVEQWETTVCEILPKLVPQCVIRVFCEWAFLHTRQLHHSRPDLLCRCAKILKKSIEKNLC